MLLTALVGFSFALWPLTFTWWEKNDPYYQMESANLNTMNSYYIPATITPTNEAWEVDVADYVTVSKNLHNTEQILSNADAENAAPSVIHLMSSYFGVWIQILIIITFAFIIARKPESVFSQTFAYVYEGIFEFFEDIIGESKPLRVKKFVVWLFFTILIANAFGWINDIIRFVFPFWLRNVTAPTWELEFNVALALCSTAVILYMQGKFVGGPLKLAHEYVPITGKWLMQWSKIWDIVISMFMGILDLIGVIARIISLSLRLFWNMSSWSILLNVAFLWLGAVTIGLIGSVLPVWFPLIIYLLGVLSVVIQAFVFSLIVAIGIKMVTE